MKKVIFVLALAIGLLFISCKKETSEQTAPTSEAFELSPPIKEADIAYASFLINPEKDTVVFHDGNEIKIPKKAFLNEKGEAISTPVNLKFRSLTNPLEIYLSGVPMVYTADGREQVFESAGMFDIQADENGKPVFVNPENIGGWIYFSSNYNNKFAIDFEPFITHVINENRYEAGVNISPRYRFSDKFSLVYGFNYFKQKNDIGFIDFEGSNIIFARRDRDTYTNSITSKFSISSVMNFNLSVRHYWSLAENNKINNLNEDGSLSLNNTYTGNRNSNFSTWNLDLSYSWWFAPGSQMSILYRNNAGTFDREINKDFGSNFSNLFEDNLNHVLSVSVRYFIDYNQAKNWIRKG